MAGLLTAIAAGVAVAAIHGMATITFRVDQIVSGVAINILAIGFPRFLSIVAYGQGTQSPQVPQLPKIDIPGLGEQSIMVPVTILLGAERSGRVQARAVAVDHMIVLVGDDLGWLLRRLEHPLQ